MGLQEEVMGYEIRTRERRLREVEKNNWRLPREDLRAMERENDRKRNREYNVEQIHKNDEGDKI